MLVNRFDTAQMHKPTKLSNGFLKVPVTVTRTGVLNYRIKEGNKFSVRKEVRLPQHVFNQDSLATLDGIPLTDKHPPGLLKPENVTKYMVGSVSGGVSRRDAEDGFSYVDTHTTLMSDKVIKKVENSPIRQVSSGYTCELIKKDGMYNGEAYTHIQTNIKYNHLAIEEKGRAGSKVRLRMDSDGEVVEGDYKEPEPIINKPEGEKMKVTLDGVEFETSNSSLISAIGQSLTRRDSQNALITKELNDYKASTSKKADEAQGKFDALEEDVKKLRLDAENLDVNALVKARVNLVNSAKTHLTKETFDKIDDMSEKEIKVAVIASKSENFDAKDKSDDYISARFDAAMESAPASTKGKTPLDKAIAGKQKDKMDNADVKTAAQIRQDSMDVSQAAWKQPMSSSTRKES